MILAADVGGSKTLVGLFDEARPRPNVVEVQTLRTLDYDGLPALLDAALGDRVRSVDRVSLGVAGPIVDDGATLTNVPWRVSRRELVAAIGVERVLLLNDLEAMAYAVPVLQPSELHTLQDRPPRPGGNAALIAAGTGLGEAILHWVDGRFVPVPSEAGHADFAARTPAELRLVADLAASIGRVDIERVVSGIGLVHIAVHLHGGDRCGVAGVLDDAGGTARVADAAAAGRCEICAATMELFADAYGAEAGNLALRAVATAGVYVGGGIAPKNLSLLDRRFMAPFLDKAPMTSLLASMPVHVILNDQAGLVGAAVAAVSSGRLD